MLSGPEERGSCRTKPPAPSPSPPDDEERRKAECCRWGEEGAGGVWGAGGLGVGAHRVPALSAAQSARSLGCRVSSASGQRPGYRPGLRHARPQRDQQIKLVLLVKHPALKIKNNKARERENAKLTAASGEGRSTEPEARNSPSLLYRVGFFFSVN